MMVTTVDWSPRLPCPKGCKAFDSRGTFATQSVCWYMGKDTGSASSWCVLCQMHFVWEFNPDIPFDNQPISFRADPTHKVLKGRLTKVSKKKGKGDTRASDNNG